MHPTNATTVPVQVQVTGERALGVAEYAEERLRDALRFAHGPVLHARIRVVRHQDPALERPIVAQANADVNGRPIRVQVTATDAAEAVDLLHDRLRRRLRREQYRAGGHWEDRRGRVPSAEPGEWRHGEEPAQRPPYFPRPPEERGIVRHKSVTPRQANVDEAAFDMDELDYDFHLFSEIGSGQDSVLYRAGETGYRLAQLEPRPEAVAPHALPLTISEQPAPALSIEEATERMASLGQPFLFFLDAERNRAALLYHRYDGHYGLITPAD